MHSNASYFHLPEPQSQDKKESKQRQKSKQKPLRLVDKPVDESRREETEIDDERNIWAI